MATTETPTTDIFCRLFTRQETCDNLVDSAITLVRRRYRHLMEAYHGQTFDAVAGSRDKCIRAVLLLAAIVNETDVRETVVQMCVDKERTNVFVDWMGSMLKETLQKAITPENADELFQAFVVACAQAWMSVDTSVLREELSENKDKK